jgi:hypothetical protein
MTREDDKTSVADSFSGSFFIPANEEDWTNLATKGKLLGKTIHDLPKMTSGSKILKKQFIMLRSLWLPRQTMQRFNDAML